MVVVINDDRVSDVEAYLPIAKAFAADAVKNDEGCISMEVLVDTKIPGRVVYLSHLRARRHFRKMRPGRRSRNGSRSWGSISSVRKILY